MFKSKTILVYTLNVLVIALAMLLNPRFQTNDDIGMIYAFSGTGMFDTPTPVTAFATKIFGLLMVSLYKIVPSDMEIYTYVLIFLLFFSNIVVHTKLLEYFDYKKISFWIFFIPILIFITLYFYIELQFTMVAGWLGFAGVLTISDKSNKKDKIIGIVLLVFSTLLRPSIVPIILGFILLLKISFDLISKESIVGLKPFILNYLLYTFIFFIVYFLDIQIHNKEEKQFLKFNTFRSGIVDFNINQTKGNSNPFHWEKEDLDLFKNWFYNDSILFSKQNNYDIATSNQHNLFIDKLKIENLKLSMLINQLRGPTYRCIFIILLIPILLFKKGWNSFKLLIFFLIIYFLYYTLLSILFKEPPFRVSFMMFSAGIVYYLITISKNDVEKVFYYKNWKTILCFTLILYAFWITKISMNIRKNDFLLNSCEEKYNPKIMYIRWKDYPYDYKNPFQISSSLKNIKLVSMGAFSVHPSIKNTFGKIRYSNLTNDIIGMDSIVSFLLPKDKLQWGSLEKSYINFISKHYHKIIYFEEVINVHHCYDYKEYKIKLKKNETKLD